MKIIFWGTPEYAVKSLENLISSRHEIVAVITQPDRKRLRGKNLIPSPIKSCSIENKIDVLCPENIRDNKKFIETLKKFNCDLFVVVAYGKILSREILNIPKYGSWNSHASLLPTWRGAAPIQWALLSGDLDTGVGIMKMEEGLDTGNILIEEKIKIEKDDNLETLSNKLSLLSADLLIKAIELISKNYENQLNTIPQNTIVRKLKYARLIHKSDYKISFNDKAIQIKRKINGLFPNAYIKNKNNNKIIKILKIRFLDNEEFKTINFSLNRELIVPGQIVGIIKNEGIIVNTLNEMVVIQEIKMEGKNISKGNQLIQQLKPVIGDIFSH